MIRVFARKTSMTPDDELAFYGEPPMWNLPKLQIFISVTFTWDIKRGKQLKKNWQQRFPEQAVFLGGPALTPKRSNIIDSYFMPGRFLKEGITITSRGCPKNCSWCLVRQREGELREINIAPGYIIQDNNLLACSRGHIEKVFEMLSRQKRAAQFKGGLDIDYLQPWHIELMKQIRIGELWVACDHERDLSRLDKARDLLGDWPIGKRYCYALVGFEGDTPSAAIKRCEKIYDNEHGFLPRVQFYQPPTAKSRLVPKEWQAIVRKWSRPAAYRPKKSKGI
jgi:hypothetical protein